MKLISLTFTFAFTFIMANDFLEYSGEKLKKVSIRCQNPKYYIEQANIEESNPENQNKIILYHGQSYGSWLFQLILKEFMFPGADEDWLPLRYNPLEKDIDRHDLMKLIYKGHMDNKPTYRELGLSVSANLVSGGHTESAWYYICSRTQYAWHKLSGLSTFMGDNSLHISMYGMIKKKFIPEQHWERFKRQKKLIYKFIQIKRTQSQNHEADSLLSDIKNLFPGTFREYHHILKSLPSDWENYQRRNDDKNEGVALQIIMDKDLADKLTYESKTFGWVESRKHKKFENRVQWEGEDIESYSEFYHEVKNKKDFNQARIAMNRDFRYFPSRVRIKSIAGIMENPIDYEIMKSMIKEMVKVNKKMEVPSCQKSSWLSLTSPLIKWRKNIG